MRGPNAFYIKNAKCDRMLWVPKYFFGTLEQIILVTNIRTATLLLITPQMPFFAFGKKCSNVLLVGCVEDPIMLSGKQWRLFGDTYFKPLLFKLKSRPSALKAKWCFNLQFFISLYLHFSQKAKETIHITQNTWSRLSSIRINYIYKQSKWRIGPILYEKLVCIHSIPSVYRLSFSQI